jgi:chemotaxis signal transduction protein
MVLERGRDRDSSKRLVTIFSVGEVRFAIGVDTMGEIVQLSEVTSDPQKKYILGWTVLRGKKIPVLDIAGFFGIGTRREGRGTGSMILLKHDGRTTAQPAEVGVIVDRIEVVHGESGLTFFPFPRVAQNDNTGVYTGILLRHDELIFTLDVGRLIDRAWTAH